MRSLWGAAHGVALCLALSGCATLGSGIPVAPPGVAAPVFRQCLLDRGFYGRPAPTADTVLGQSAGAFVVGAAATIADGLMPTLAYDPDAKVRSGREGRDQ